MFTVPTVLPDDPAALQLILHAALAEIERLRLLIAGLQRNRFGRRSERLDDAAFHQGVENLEQSLAEQMAKLDAASSAAAISTPEPTLRPPRTEPAKRNRGALPAHLPRIEVVIDVADKACPCCGGLLHVIGEDRAEMLDYVPAQLRVRVIRRPRYGCRACEEAVVQAPAPERPIDGGMATEALLAHVLVNKYADHLPLYRQAQIFARQGVTLDRSTLCTWVGRACWWLAPLHELVLSTVLTSPKVFADDTTLPVLDPGRGRTKTGRLWCYAVDNRPWRGPGHPAAAYVYSEDRKGEHPATHLKGFRGLLQVDGYAGFGRLVADMGNVSQLAFCWAHARRKFYDIYAATQSPLAGEALRQIAALYEIEDEIRGQPVEERRRVREQRSRPLIEAMQAWLAETLGRISGRSALAQAIRYALNHWSGLILFLDDGRLELDTNTVERAMRPVALGRKNALFAGSDSGGRHWAIIATLIQSAKLNDVDPLAWLIDVLERIVSGRTKRNELDTLLPWNWKAAAAAETHDTT
ncbi:MAG TPA: IS66 family transposase [Candidatus Angelobacter sp.]|nr:IS66 family transposase [Candidatus Angelobacter sp.]